MFGKIQNTKARLLFNCLFYAGLLCMIARIGARWAKREELLEVLSYTALAFLLGALMVRVVYYFFPAWFGDLPGTDKEQH